MKAVILAAGKGSRLEPITSSKPKCMVNAAGYPILGHQLRACASAGLDEVIIVTGYMSGAVSSFCNSQNDIETHLVENLEYAETNNMYSLFLTDQLIGNEGFLLCNGDVVLDPEILKALVESSEEDAIAVDAGAFLEESMKVSLDSEGFINDINKEMTPPDSFGVSIDLYRFSPRSSRELFRYMREHIVEKGRRNEWTEVAIQALLLNGSIKMRPHNIDGRNWVEIDNVDDLLEADSLFSGLDRSLESKRLVFLDMDGTVYLGNDPIQGSSSFIDNLRGKGIKHYFLSNNSSRSKTDYVKKLGTMGIEAVESDIILSTDGLIEYMLSQGVKEVFVLGTESMKTAVADAGIKVDSAVPDYVVVGYDTELTYQKLRDAAIHIMNGVGILASHCDLVCPTPDGPIPDIGSMLALLETATGRKPERIFGKPNPEMISHVLDTHGVEPAEALIIGDRLYTDMELARRTGCDFILVLSGETDRAQVEELDNAPDLIVDSLASIYEDGNQGPA